MGPSTSLLPCIFRQIHMGRTLCSRSSDEYDQEVWPDECARCVVPTWLQEGICTHLDIGVTIDHELGPKTPAVLTACRFFSERLEGVSRCRNCPEFSPWERGADLSPTAAQQIAAAVPPDLLEEAVEEALTQHVAQASPRMMTGCFRAGVTRCLYAPELHPTWVLVLPPSSLQPAEPYRALVTGILQEGGLEALFFRGPLKDIDSLCDLCLATQQSPSLVIDLSEWDAATLFALGLGGALGRPLLLLRERDLTPPFVPQGLPVYEYSSGEELAMFLVQGLGIQLRAGGEGPAGEGEETAAAEERSTGEDGAATEEPGKEPAAKKMIEPAKRPAEKPVGGEE